MMHVQQVKRARGSKNAAVHDSSVVRIHLTQGHVSALLLCLEFGWIHLQEQYTLVLQDLLPGMLQACAWL